MRTFLVSYATPNFAEVRRELNHSAVRCGVENIFSFTDADLRATRFYRQNRRILDAVCGAGYWAWKPFFVLEALQHLAEGDILFYCDAGSAFVAPPDRLIEICRTNASGLVLFDARPLTNRQFTKRDCFIRLRCDAPEHWDAVKVIGTVVIVRKSKRTVRFIQEWLSHCQDPAAITHEKSFCGRAELQGFLVHRWDQAILSVLASKHKIETYRNPSVWGNFLKLPEYRVPGETVTSPYGLIPEISDYAREPQANSPYGTIFEFNRQPNFEGKPPVPASVENAGPAASEERNGTDARGTFTKVRHAIGRRVRRALRANVI